MGLKDVDYWSIERYIQYEYTTEAKHEYERGEILMMSGGTINHGVLCGNAYNELRNGLEKSPKNCRALGSEIRIYIDKAESIVYPDAMVICGEIETSQEDKDAVVNPILVVEVLSKSTESYDRGDKFYKYRQLKSLKEYILINQDKAVVETFYKKADNVWEISRISGLNASIELQSIGVHLDMQSLYRDLKLID